MRSGSRKANHSFDFRNPRQIQSPTPADTIPGKNKFAAYIILQEEASLGSNLSFSMRTASPSKRRAGIEATGSGTRRSLVGNVPMSPFPFRLAGSAELWRRRSPLRRGCRVGHPSYPCSSHGCGRGRSYSSRRPPLLCKRTECRWVGCV